MLGCPARNAKTLVITENEDLARRLVFVFSYFVRCSQIFEQKLNFPDIGGESINYRINKNDLKKRISKENVSIAKKASNLSRSNSSPTIEPKNPQNCTMKKSKSYICSLSDMNTKSEPQLAEPKQGREKVNFMIGENENLELSQDSGEDSHDEFTIDITQGMERVRMNEEVTITKGVSITMKDADTDKETDEDYNYIDITEIPLIQCEVISSAPASMPSLICCTDQYMPGTVLQVSFAKFWFLIPKLIFKGCFGQTDHGWRGPLQTDLMATASNHFVAGASDESICVVGDCTKNEVCHVFKLIEEETWFIR